ncbi:AraC family transcriptional regulator [Spirosoma sp. KNUC1025]|uniref:helix-turn-helix domain-containing protein n=1 Tax=Spirosoma sp. KNUC1025 TaxID=2894082 RepID=UPI001E3C1889|nr:helix-turn-helix domain-containing protein [Spirosoma sp. KNUC1025]UFH57800.1 AraC family transcriptional regulator [Spirosoma sp. KNUC1025]
MKRYILYSAFSIYHFEASTWAHATHKHTYFEIIFVLRGHGNHHINGSTYSYGAGDVFLLGPEDYHHFTIEGLTEFSFIRFNESVQKHAQGEATWQAVITTLLTTSSQSRGSLVTDPLEKQKLNYLREVLEAENARQPAHYFEPMRDSLLRSMLLILARNLFQHPPSSPVVRDSVEAILLYIKQHIHQPALLSIDSLARVFHYSPAYISLYFKKHTGESLKQYITRHKIKLLEARLLYSSVSLAQLADEFGYTDESHLCKHFKKYTGYTPTSFRQGGEPAAALV